jgi:hypothetical protein
MTSFLPVFLPSCALQHFGHPHASIDIMRAARLGAYGLLIDGPIGSKWYDVLEAYVFPKDPISTKAVLAKTALDQVVYATIMTGVCSLLPAAFFLSACITMSQHYNEPARYVI